MREGQLKYHTKLLKYQKHQEENAFQLVLRWNKEVLLKKSKKNYPKTIKNYIVPLKTNKRLK